MLEKISSTINLFIGICTIFLALEQSNYMKYILALVFVVPVVLFAQTGNRFHQKLWMVDTHNDVLTAVIENKLLLDADLKGRTHSDLNRFIAAGMNLQLFSVWCDGEKQNPYDWALREIDTLYAVSARNPNKIAIVANTQEAKMASKQGKLAAMFGVEGGHMIENDLGKLETLYSRGVRYMTLTWNNSTSWSSSALTETFSKEGNGLSDFGKQVVQKMNQLGMLVDLSHVGEKTFWDAIATTNKPVLVSHSNAYNLCPIFRNLKDEQIDAVGKNGGVIHLNFYSGFIDKDFKTKESAFLKKYAVEIDSIMKTGMQKEYAQAAITKKYQEEANAFRPKLTQLLDHLDYIVKRIGVEHVGMGSDFDGISSSPLELNEVTDYYKITDALLERGYSKKDVKKIMGENFMRVLKANEN